MTCGATSIAALVTAEVAGRALACVRGAVVVNMNLILTPLDFSKNCYIYIYIYIVVQVIRPPSKSILKIACEIARCSKVPIKYMQSG